MAEKTYLIFGISKGLGKSITLNLPDEKDQVFGISRSEPSYLHKQPNLQWIAADLSNPQQSSETIKASIGNQKIDCLIYNVGIWENHAFTEDYNFEQSSVAEISNLLQTNLTSCIVNIQSVLENLKLAENAKIILIGSTWGLDNHNGIEVAFSASKFGLRGVVHSLREYLRPYSIGISILNLGYLDTEHDGHEAALLDKDNTATDLIPLHDVLQALRFIISTSNQSCVKEINMPAMQDSNM